MNMKKVSIIIPIYNVINFIEECIESAVNQTYTNIEIILVNDGSSDNSGIICDKWARRDERIKVINKQNGGLSDARNAGLNLASGDYIYFLDGDDYVSEKLLEATIPHFDNGVGLVSFQYYLKFPDGKLRESHFLPRNYCINCGNDLLNFVTQSLLRYKLGWEAWGKIYRRDVIEMNKIRFADNKKIFAEDMFFILCYCIFAKEICVIPDCLYYYRQRNDSIMKTQFTALNAGRMTRLCIELYQFYVKHQESGVLLDHFSLIYYLVLNNVISRYKSTNKLSTPNMRKALLNDIFNYKYAKNQFRNLSKERKQLYLICKNPEDVETIISIAKYYSNGSRALYYIRRIVVLAITHILNIEAFYKESILYKIKQFSKNKKKCFLIGTEDFGNLGDHKIAETQLSFLKKHLVDYCIMEITASEYRKCYEYLKKYIKSNDILFLTGGGNFGNEYPFAQDIKDSVCTTWKENKKIVFPQTVFFTDTDEGTKRLSRANEIYCKENNIFLFTRERRSFEFAKKNFTCDVFCIPDIVLSNNMIQYKTIREGVLFCLRSDKEKRISNDAQEKLKQEISALSIRIKLTDLQLPYSINKEERYSAICEKMREFSEAELVITDRLHGMIFAALTGTPCIAFSNYNHKVKGTYEWISYLPYIRYVETLEEANEAIPKLLKLKGCYFDNDPLLPYFDVLSKVVIEQCRP